MENQQIITALQNVLAGFAPDSDDKAAFKYLLRSLQLEVSNK